jgi:murein DD-endopeptidase MepM/ murein hydrolase activator NlpD
VVRNRELAEKLPNSRLIVHYVVAVVAGLLGILLISPAPATADPTQDKQRVDQQIAQISAELETASSQVQQAAVSYTEAVAAIPAAETAVADARGQVIGAQAAARTAQRQARTAQQDAAAADSRYLAASAEEEQARAEVNSFTTQIYRGADLMMLDAAVQTQNPTDFLGDLGYLERIVDKRQKAVSQYSARRAAAKRQCVQADQARSRATTAEQAAKQALERARAKQRTAEQVQTKLQNLVKQRETALAEAESQRGTVVAQLDALNAESDRLAAQLRQAAENERRSSAGDGRGISRSDPGQGKFLKPVDGWLSSPFGMRLHPIYKVWRFHSGIDLAAASGTPIYATASGRVVTAGWSGGYGQYTCVYHEDGVSSCYAHQSQIDVSVGQWVQRGQQIGRVGTTGASTGCHLHFEIRIDGQPVDPLQWISL